MQLNHAASAYNFANLLGKILSRSAQRLRGADILTALKSVKDEVGVQGKYSYIAPSDGVGYFNFPVVIRKVDGGRIIDAG